MSWGGRMVNARPALCRAEMLVCDAVFRIRMAAATLNKNGALAPELRSGKGGWSGIPDSQTGTRSGSVDAAPRSACGVANASRDGKTLLFAEYKVTSSITMVEYQQ
jgi:hypothetical protein